MTATLTAPATVTIRGSAIELTPLDLDFGQGNLMAQGKLDESFDVDIAIRDLPLAIANAIRPDLGLVGDRQRHGAGHRPARHARRALRHRRRRRRIGDHPQRRPAAGRR